MKGGGERGDRESLSCFFGDKLSKTKDRNYIVVVFQIFEFRGNFFNEFHCDR